MNQARILIVEDETIVARDLTLTLEALGYEISGTATSAQQAIASSDSSEPDLVLMDIRLQGELDGVDAASEIRRRFDIPIVYMTAYPSRDSLNSIKSSEPYGYLLKPFNERELETAIELALYKHRTDHELKESRKWFLTTLNAITDGIVTTDAKGNINFFNSVAENLIGWSSAEAMGKHWKEVFRIIPDSSCPAPDDPFDRLVPGELILSKATEAQLETKTWERIRIEYNATILQNDNGYMVGGALVFRDITERIHDQLETQKVQLHLFQLQKTEAVAELGSGLAHDLNNAIGRVVGHLELLQSQPLSSDIRASIDEALKGCGAASSLMEEFLNHTGQWVSNFQELSLVDEVYRVVDSLPRALNRRIVLNVEGSSSMYVKADSTQLEQVLRNLILIAYQAMPTSDRSICVSLTSEHLDTAEEVESGSTEKQYAVVRIDCSEEIFEDPGHAMVRRIMHSHGGHFISSLDKNSGTTFALFFPLFNSLNDENKKEVTPQSSFVERAIMVVDDEPAITHIMERFLTKLKYRVIAFNSSGDAMQWYREHWPEIDLIFLDMKMPELDGNRCFGIIKSIQPEARIAFCSGFIEDSHARELLSQGGLAVFKKPFQMARIADWISTTLGRPVTKFDSMR